ncbi:Ubiquitin-like protein [Rhizina undulata]
MWNSILSLQEKMSAPGSGTEDMTQAAKIPEEDAGELPVAATASMVLTSLPRDGKMALDRAVHPKPERVSVRFKAIGSAPHLNRDVYKIKTTQKFESVVKFLRDTLQISPADSIFLYINSSFAPALDENVGNLFDCFRIDDQLLVSYCMTAAFG